jgi:hypothetical protein
MVYQNALVADQSLGNCQYRHRYTTCQGTLHPRRDRIDLEGNPAPVRFMCDPSHASNSSRLRKIEA